MTKMEIQPGLTVSADLDALSTTAAELITQLLTDAVRKFGIATIALSGGSTPCRLYRLLARNPYRNRIPWEKTHLFWGDERCVPPDHPDSNYLMARRAMLDDLQIPEMNIHRVRAEESQEQAASEYERELRDFFEPPAGRFPHFDVMLLGLGEDGHTASLFPGGLELFEMDRIAIGTQKPGGWRRISLTIPTLNASRNVVFVVSGESKAHMLPRAMSQPDMNVPASMVKPEGNLFYLADVAATLQMNPG
jgi:6-phosphogluconolactonase